MPINGERTSWKALGNKESSEGSRARGSFFLLSFSVLHLLLDALMLFFAFSLAYLLRFKSGLPVPLGQVPYSAYFQLWLFSLPVWWIIFAYHGLYFARLQESFLNELSRLPSAVSISIVSTIVISFFVRGLPESRLTFLFLFFLALVLVALFRWFARLNLAQLSPSILLIGSAPTKEILMHRIKRRFGKGARILEMNEEELQVKIIEANLSPFSLAEKFTEEKPKEIICFGSPPQPVSHALMQIAFSGSSRVRFMPAGDALFLGTAHLSPEYGLPEICPKSFIELMAIRRAKRVIDLCLGIPLFILVSPLLFVIGFLVWLTSPGGIFFIQERSGLGGKPFKLWKFRTMYLSASLTPELEKEFTSSYKLKEDPRITPLGRWLRRTSLDELPQLINVIRGEMSLVGPRPIVLPETEKYGVWSNVLLSFPPGLTGLWQVSGRSELSYSERVDLDIYYIMNWSPALDFSILLRTFVAILSGRGAY